MQNLQNQEEKTESQKCRFLVIAVHVTQNMQIFLRFGLKKQIIHNAILSRELDNFL